MDELDERLARLAPLATRPRHEFDADPYLRDIVERNLEIAAQCCIDIGHRAVSLLRAAQPRDYHEALLRLGELGIVEPELASRLAPLAGLRNVLVHEYVAVDWDEVVASLGQLDDLRSLAEQVRAWIRRQEAAGSAE